MDQQTNRAVRSVVRALGAARLARVERARVRAVYRGGDADELARALTAGGGHTALPLLIDRYGLAVYRYCRRMLGDDGDCDDVSQLVFIHAFEAIVRGWRIQNMRAYLLGITRHRCLDRLKTRRSAPLLLDAEELERALESGAPADPLCGTQRSQALEECLDELDARSRTILLHRFHDDLSYEEIGRRTGDRPGALRVRVTRALRTLRRCMERRGIAM